MSETRETLGMDKFSFQISDHGHVNGFHLKKKSLWPVVPKTYGEAWCAIYLVDFQKKINERIANSFTFFFFLIFPPYSKGIKLSLHVYNNIFPHPLFCCNMSI